MIKLLALWLLLPGLSYSSSYTFGYSGNAALYGLTWNMTTPVLGISTENGMDISGVIYRYTAVKELGDDFTVTVQNEDVDGGYIFQDTEDWSDGPGMKIQKVIPLPYTPISQFGTGSIETTGTGSVEDASVLYMYRWDNCRNPQNDPNCPGYITPLPVIPKIEIYDALEDEYVQDATEKTDGVGTDKDEEIRETEEEDEEKDRLEIALAASENALTIAGGASQASLLKAMNIATNLSNYYVARVPGGVYRESISLQGGTIVDNRRALRSLGQDNLMNEMIGEQYK